MSGYNRTAAFLEGLTMKTSISSLLAVTAFAFTAAMPAAFDPGCVKTLGSLVSAQQENRTYGVCESSMRNRHSV
jgi:hypothetical protein